MPLVRVLEDYGAAEGHRPGDIVDITNPFTLIAEGKVELIEPGTDPVIAPVSVEVPENPEPEVEAPVVEEVTSEVETTETPAEEEPQEVEATVEDAEAE